MNGIELKQKYLKKEVFDKVGVIALFRDKDNKLNWFHVHENEEIPKIGSDIDYGSKVENIALHIR